jgi:DNA-binding NtrC family response regulator
MSRILIVDDEPAIGWSLRELLSDGGHTVELAASVDAALDACRHLGPDTILLDVRLPGRDGLSAIPDLRALAPGVPVIVMTAFGDLDTAVRAVHAGAFDYLVKPFDLERITEVVDRALAERTGTQSGAAAQPAAPSARLVGLAPPMQEVFKQIALVAATDLPVLIEGETGTGKELAARAIHDHGGRRERPFVATNLAALAPGIVESELFGHVRGAFTGATADRPGLFELADGGTIFLDEITTASPALQVKLLRVLQERQFEPLGGRDTITIDARVILATNDDLAALVASGRFRADLFWRIAVVTIAMPPLRERADDIPALAAHFLTAAAARAGRRVEGFTPRAIEALRAHRWPGNVRELEHAVERAVLLGRDAVVDLPDLPSTVASGSIPAAPATHRCGLKHDLAGPERRLILDALENAGWRRDTAARSLGINRTTLYKKLKRLGIDLADVAPSR